MNQRLTNFQNNQEQGIVNQ